MIGEKALGDRLAKRLDEYAAAWGAQSGGTDDQRRNRTIVAEVLAIIAQVIRDVTQ